ncbi:MAG: hypothetical protein ACLP1Y_16190 [Candidatus Acidiferrales bacterium]
MIPALIPPAALKIKMPWAIHWSNDRWKHQSASMWWGWKSPVCPAGRSAISGISRAALIFASFRFFQLDTPATPHHYLWLEW